MVTLLTTALLSAMPMTSADALAVVPLRTQTLSAKTAAVLDNLLVTAVDEATSARVISPADIDTVLGIERTREAAGCDDLRCAAEIAGALGARYLVNATADVLGDELVVTMTLIDTRETSVVARKRAGVPNDESRYLAAIDEVVGAVFGAEAALGPTISATVAGAESQPRDRPRELGVHFTYLDKGEWASLAAEYGIPHSAYLATVARLGGAGFGSVNDTIGLLVGVSEELRLTLHQSASGRRAVEAFASADVNATLSGFPALQAGGSVGLRFFWLSITANAAYQLAGKTERTSWVDGTQQPYDVSMRGLTRGLSAAVTFPL